LLGTDDSDGPFSMAGSVTDAGALDEVAELALIGGTPNPFHASTRVRYALPRATRVRLEVFDLVGRRCRVLENGEMPAGRHDVAWNGRDQSGRRLAAGVYVIRMEADGRVLTRRIARLD